MFWPMSRRAIASIVGFFLGWTVFQIVTPIQEIAMTAPPAVEILSITLKRHGCTDAELECPVFDVTFRNDGTAIYTGYANDDLIGKHKAKIEKEDFAYLVEQIQKQRFFELPQFYDTGFEEEDIKLEVLTNEGLRVVSTQNWASTPSELRALKALVEEQAYHVYWEEDE